MSIKTFLSLGVGGDAAAVILLGFEPSAFPAPSSVKISSVPIGASYITADGAMHLDSIGYRRRLSVTWERVSTAQRNLMRGYLVGGVSFSLVVPGDATYTVVPVRGKYRHSPTGGISETWTVSGEVETTT